MRTNKDIERLKKDAVNFGLSAAGHIHPSIGKALGIYDTYEKGIKLTKSANRAYTSLKRKYKAKARTRIRKITRFL